VKYVYILQSKQYAEHFYTGITGVLDARLSKHISGEVPHTAKFRPWRIKSFVAFTDDTRAFAFEKYLKSGSGRAFAKKRLCRMRQKHLASDAVANISHPQ
jgi:putative endonuclease